MKFVISTLLMLAIAVFTTSVQAQAPAEEPHEVAQSGGGKSTGSGFQLQSVVGQPIAGLKSGSNNTLRQGFLHVVVSQINAPPTATAQTVTAPEDTDITITLAGTDPENSTLATSITTLPANGFLYQTSDGTTRGALISSVPTQISDGSKRVIYVSAANGSGSDHGNFGFKVNDGTQDSPEALVTVNVTAVNDPPTLATIPNPPAINQDSGQQIINFSGVSAGGAESEPLTIAAQSNNTGLIPNPTISYTSPNTTGSLAYTPVSGANGSAIITVTVSDGALTVSQSFTITVNGENPPPPVVVGPSIPDVAPQTAVEGNPFVFSVPVNSTASSSVGISIVSFTEQIASVETSGRTITATPGPGQFTAEIVVQATDDNGASSPKTIIVTWGPPPNQPPIIAAIEPQSAARGTPISFDVTVTDEDTTTVMLSVTSFTRALIADIQISGKTITLTPIPGSFSTEIEIQATDNQGLASQQVKIPLTWLPPANIPPVFELAAFSPPDGTADLASPVTLLWNATDADNNPLVYTVKLGQTVNVLADRATDLTQTTLTFGSEPNRTWFWQIIVSDGTDADTSGVFSLSVRGDTRAPILSRIDVEANVNTARITWTTDELALASLKYGTESNLAEFVTIAGAGDLQTNHAISIPGLEPSTTYFFEALSIDPDNNEGKSDILAFSTLAAPDVTPAQITGPFAEGIGHNSASIRWTTDERTVGTYTLTGSGAPIDGILQDAALDHLVTFTDLQAQTEYTFSLNALDPAGNPTLATLTFITRAAPDTRPPEWVRRPQVIPSDISAQVTFEASEPARAVIAYGSNANDLTNTLTTEPSLTFAPELIGLTASSDYTLRVTLTDLAGNEKQSGLIRFRTEPAPDVLAPLILGAPEIRGLTQEKATAAWETNELSFSRVIYDSVAITNTSPRTPLSDQPATVHTRQITGLRAATQYAFQVVSIDLSGNRAIVDGSAFSTPKAPDVTPPQLTTPIVPTTTSFNYITLEWETDEAARSTVTATPVIALKTQNQSLETVVATETDLVRTHRVQVFGLVSGISYSITVHLQDAVGNGVEIALPEPVQTLELPDLEPPVIVRRPIVTAKHNRATVQWTVDEPSDGFFTIATNTSFSDARTVGTTALSEHHTLTIAGLIPQTRYYYRIASTDVAENGPTILPEEGRTFTFRTTRGPDQIPPVIENGPNVESLTENGARLSIRLNEPSTIRVRFAQTEAELNTSHGLFRGSTQKEHRIDLRQLQSGTQYFYRFEATDGSRNGPTLSPVRSFRTKTAPDRTPPTIVSGPVPFQLSPTEALIVWSTDEPSNSEVVVRRGPRKRSAELTRDHRILVTGLRSNRNYRYEIKSTDAAGNTARRTRKRFRTPRQIDQTAPQILEGPAISYRSNTRATFSVRTDESTHMEIVVGSEADFDTDNTLPPVFSVRPRTHHNQTVAGLTPGKAYRYRVIVTDAAGNQTVEGILTGFVAKPGVMTKYQPPGGDGSFTTATQADTQFPVILDGPHVVASSSDALTIEWTTDESSDSGIDFGIDDLHQRIEDGADVQNHRLVIAGLEPATTYQYRVDATDPAGNGATQSRVFLAKTSATADINPPQITTSPHVIYLTERTATLAWETNEASETFVDYGIDSLDNQKASPDYVQTHQMTLTNLAPATTYRYRVSATDEAGNGPVTNATLTFTTESAPDRTPPELLGTPSTFTTESTATITWQTDELSDSAVRFATGDGISQDALGLLEGSARDVTHHTVTLTNLTPSTTYTYIVQSIDRSDNGPTQSSPVTFTTAADKDEIPPGVPQDLTARSGQNEIVLTWTAPTDQDIAGYDILRALDTSSDFAPIATQIQGTLFRDTGLDPSTPYHYQIQAVDRAANTGALSEPITARADGSGFPATPSGGQILGDPLRPTLSVENVATTVALTYGFQIATDPEFADILTQTTGITPSSNTDQAGRTAWTIDVVLEDGTTYYWRCWVSDDLFVGPFMPAIEFLAAQSIANNPGDFNGDLHVGFPDFIMFAGGFGSQVGDTRYLAILDLNNDSVIDFTDFIAFAGLFGTSY